MAHRYYGRGIDTGKDEMYNDYIKGADIVCFDIYPVNAEEPDVRDKLWLVAGGVDNLIARSGGKKPVWAWIETGSINGVNRPSPEQIRSKVWMAVIHGAKGIGYFMHEFAPVFHEAGLLTDSANAANRAMVSSINRMIAELAPVINSPEMNCASVTSENSSVPVDIMTREHEGEIYIFAAAMRGAETVTVFTVGSGAGREAEAVGENRTLAIESGRFTDHFGPFGIHIYRIKK